jgi:glycosyltransferase involved in cell wall biosynthesis
MSENDVDISNSQIFQVGKKYNHEKYYYLKSVDAVIVPSFHESFCLVALESLACKTLLFASMVGGMTEYLDESCCVFCGTDEKTITNALHSWCNDLNEMKISFLKQNGFLVAKKFNWEQAAKDLQMIYQM